jgi:transcription termination/antitermination protein NusA
MIQYDLKTIGLINIFEKITRAKVKDCFNEGEFLTFVVQQGEARKAVGQNGENLKKLSRLMKTEIKIIQFNKDPEKFVLNIIFPLKPDTELKEKILILKPKNPKEKGKIFGSQRANLKRIQKLLEKYFKLEVKVQ